MSTTKPAPDYEAVPCGTYKTSISLISPLTRAALDNGIAFDDVAAYAQADARATAQRYHDLSWELLVDGGGE